MQFRLTAAQRHAIGFGLAVLLKEHETWKAKGVAYGYPGWLEHPRKQEALYDAAFMAEIEEANSRVASASGKTCRVSWNTLQIRAAILAARVQADHLRFLRRKLLKQERGIRNGTILFPPKLTVVNQHDVDLAQRAAKKLSNSLHRYLKRANRRLIKHVGHEEYQVLCRRWRRHLLWVRIRLVYFRPFPLPFNRGRTQREVVGAVAQNMRLGLKQLKRIPPGPKKLRELARGALWRARRGRSGKSVFELIDPTKATLEYLGEFAIFRCHLKRVAEDFTEQSDQSKRSEVSTRAAHKELEHRDPPIEPERPINTQRKKVPPRRLAPHRKHQHLALADPRNRERLTALMTNWAKLDLVGQADEICSLISLGCTQRGLAKELGVAPTTICRRVQIAHLSEEHRIAIASGARAKAILEQVRTEKIERQLAARFSRPAYRAQRIRELQDFLADVIVNFKISPRMYKELKRPILEFARIEAHRLGDKRLPEPARLFAKVLKSSEPPTTNERQAFLRQQEWMGTAISRIEPDQTVITEAVAGLLAVLVDQNQRTQAAARFNERLRVLGQSKPERKKTSLRGSAPRVPTRTDLNHPF